MKKIINVLLVVIASVFSIACGNNPDPVTFNDTLVDKVDSAVMYQNLIADYVDSPDAQKHLDNFNAYIEKSEKSIDKYNDYQDGKRFLDATKSFLKTMKGTLNNEGKKIIDGFSYLQKGEELPPPYTMDNITEWDVKIQSDITKEKIQFNIAQKDYASKHNLEIKE